MRNWFEGDADERTVLVIAPGLNGGRGLMTEYPIAFLARYGELESGGRRGKELINELLQADWKIPPIALHLIWTDPSGVAQSRHIRYE